ncbi:MAG: hypothetical protein QM736_19530 [Vicinamibacterales bacterium]
MFSPSLPMAATLAAPDRSDSVSHGLVCGVAALLMRGDDVLDRLLEVVRARDEVRFAVHFDEHADLMIRVEL